MALTTAAANSRRNSGFMGVKWKLWILSDYHSRQENPGPTRFCGAQLESIKLPACSRQTMADQILLTLPAKMMLSNVRPNDLAVKFCITEPPSQRTLSPALTSVSGAATHTMVPP